VFCCIASRENAVAPEAWVHTPGLTDRGRGYARQVTLAWARDAQRSGKAALYGHSLDNLASQAVARRPGLVEYMTEAKYH
jgi:hypothetical protein